MRRSCKKETERQNFVTSFFFFFDPDSFQQRGKIEIRSFSFGSKIDNPGNLCNVLSLKILEGLGSSAVLYPSSILVSETLDSYTQLSENRKCRCDGEPECNHCATFYSSVTQCPLVFTVNLKLLRRSWHG